MRLDKLTTDEKRLRLTRLEQLCEKAQEFEEVLQSKEFDDSDREVFTETIDLIKREITRANSSIFEDLKKLEIIAANVFRDVLFSPDDYVSITLAGKLKIIKVDKEGHEIASFVIKEPTMEHFSRLYKMTSKLIEDFNANKELWSKIFDDEEKYDTFRSYHLNSFNMMKHLVESYEEYLYLARKDGIEITIESYYDDEEPGYDVTIYHENTSIRYETHSSPAEKLAKMIETKSIEINL